MDMREQTQNDFRNITDTFCATDGGIRFTNFRFFIEDIDKKAANGDKLAQKMLHAMHRFASLIDVGAGPYAKLRSLKG